jgi:hypothetical protein
MRSTRPIVVMLVLVLLPTAALSVTRTARRARR